MIPMGCDFAYQNARAEFANVERMIDYFNKNNKSNMKFKMSTPGEYIEALKKENIVWPVRYGDAFPYADGENDYWTGYFSSRPGAKKQVKDASALMNAQNRLFSKRVIKEGVTDEKVKEVLEAKRKMIEPLSIYLHHDAITGTDKQFVADDYTIRMQKGINQSNEAYKNELERYLYKYTGIEVPTQLYACQNNNETVMECPIGKKENQEVSEFIVVVHNPSHQPFKQLAKIKLPSKDYKAQVWS